MLLEFLRCFPPWENGRIDRLVALEYAGGVSAESDSNELNTLERCAVMRSEVAFPQVATPPCFWFLFSVSCRFELPLVGGEPVCYIHLILHDMEEVSRHAIFVRFKLHGA